MIGAIGFNWKIDCSFFGMKESGYTTGDIYIHAIDTIPSICSRPSDTPCMPKWSVPVPMQKYTLWPIIKGKNRHASKIEAIACDKQYRKNDNKAEQHVDKTACHIGDRQHDPRKIYLLDHVLIHYDNAGSPCPMRSWKRSMVPMPRRQKYKTSQFHARITTENTTVYTSSWSNGFINVHKKPKTWCLVSPR